MFLIPNEYWAVKDTKEKGRGVFAKKTIKPGIIIGDYIGNIVKTEEEDLSEKDKNLYLMYYHDHASIYPDLTTDGIHLLNHSCTPNCWMYTFQGHTLFFSLRKIFPEEELTISYLLSPLDEFCNPCPHVCKCKSSVCRGTMHLSEERYKQWAIFHDRQTSLTKRKKIRYGKRLSPLSDYPQLIPDNPIYALFGSEQQPPEVLKTHTLPSQNYLRKTLRETGRSIYFPSLHLKILGIIDDQIVYE